MYNTVVLIYQVESSANGNHYTNLYGGEYLFTLFDCQSFHVPVDWFVFYYKFNYIAGNQLIFVWILPLGVARIYLIR